MFTVNQLRMSQSSVDLITELHTQWMQTSRARTNSAFEEARVLLQESRALLQDIEEKMDEAWRVFHEELKAMEDQRDASLPKEPVTHPALEHMYDHIPYEDEEPVTYEEPVPIVWGYDSDEEVDNEVELLNDDELLDIVW